MSTTHNVDRYFQRRAHGVTVCIAICRLGGPSLRVGNAGWQHLSTAWRSGGVRLTGLFRARPGLRGSRSQHEVLAQRVALKLVRQQQRHQVGMAHEIDAEHLVSLSLVPGSAAVDTQ